MKKLIACCFVALACDTLLANDKLGIDFFKSNFSLKEKYGKEIYGKNLGGINIFGQHYLKGNMFIEYGYEYMRSKKEKTLNAGDYFPGGIAIAPTWFISNTKIKQQSPYFGIGYEYGFGEKTSISLLGSIAVIRVTGYHEVIDSGFGPIPQAVTAATKRNFDKTKPSVLFKLSINHEFNNCWGARLTGTWRKLDQFKIKAKDSLTSEIRLKNCASVGLGVFYNL